MVSRRVELFSVAGIVGAAAALLYVGLVVIPQLSATCPTWQGAPCRIEGSPLVLGTPTIAAFHGAHWYNFTVASSGGGMTVGDTQWQFVTATGTVVVPTVNWTMKVFDRSGVEVGVGDLALGV